LGRPWYFTYLFSTEDPEEEKALQKQLTEEYKPLLEWIKKEAKDVVQDGEFNQFNQTAVCSNSLL